jgi:hypothetical protein
MSEQEIANDMNVQLILIAGFSSGGKSASLRNIRNQERWMYLNTEAGKRLPFRNKFDKYNIDDPYQIWEAFDAATGNGPMANDVDGIIIDSATFMMDMLETQYVINSANTQKAWGDFAQFFKVLLQQKVVKFGKPVIIIAHAKEELDEVAMQLKTFVPVKGSLKNNGIESYFSTVVYAEKVDIKELEKCSNGMLEITEEERELGYKHVFQTRPTKKTVGKRIRSPMGMFSKEETYIDNDAQKLLDHLAAFYDEC